MNGHGDEYLDFIEREIAAGNAVDFTDADVESEYYASEAGPHEPPAQAASAPQDVAANLRESLWAILYNDQENQIDGELFEQAKDAIDAYDRAKSAPQSVNVEDW
jgi:hypothetical protein